MTTNLLLSSIATAISQISISGVTVKDVDEISPSWLGQANVLYPNPDPPGWISDFRLEYQSITRGAASPVDVHYTLNYRFLGLVVGDLSQFANAYSDLVTKIALIVAAIVAVHAPYSGKVEMTLGSITLGVRQDLAGNRYHGADIPLQIVETQN